ncbi:MAG: rhamnulokinase [Microbacteriaceae bacterium]|nr:rhamnulokinase [Microbacteriaceae bacterium]
MTNGTVAAVDLGATSGRVIVGTVRDQLVRLDPVARFPNTPIQTDGGMHWNTLELFHSVVDGLVQASLGNELVSVGVDSWGVDYGLIRRGELASIPFHYRDERTVAASERLLKRMSAAEMYQRTGVQHMAINTIAQLEDDRERGRLANIDRILLTPDLIGFWLTGVYFAERTIASTTGLLNATTQDWDADLFNLIGQPTSLFANLVNPGEEIAPLLPAMGLKGSAILTTVGSHDTASAVAGIPAVGDDFAYISCGTWGIVGIEVEEPIITESSRTAGFTNEGGVDGRFRFQRNAMGLWVLSETIRAWERQDGSTLDLPELLAKAEHVTATVPLFDADDPVFGTPGDMPARIAEWLSAHGLPVPASRAALTRCIIESLAEGFAHAVHQISEQTRRAVTVIHIVGGGSQNSLLCQAVADRSGLKVLAGPVEATATGNVLVQARTAGLISGGIDALRSIVANSALPRTFSPRPTNVS